ncbi:MAG: hypothetical protein RR347_07650 [Anaerovoracaceae bacterium]
MKSNILTTTNNSIFIPILMFAMGGIGYGAMEIIFRGYTHWSMCLTGGACVLTFFYLEEIIDSMSVFAAALIGATIITIYEFSIGLVVNIWFGWNVWDYTMRPGNVLGQICPLFFVLWFFLCLLFFGSIKYFKNYL